MADPPANRAVHPRRPPAHMSVSLRHSHSPGLQVPPPSSRPQHRGRIPSSNQANPPSDTSKPSDSSNEPSSINSKPQPTKQSSGESSNADTWFERSNIQVKASAADNEPPFFLRNSSSSETPPGVIENRMAQLNTQYPMLQYRNNFMHTDTQGSSSEDFRSVIDDLTVENKKLKKKLRKYEKLYDAHLQQEKLFEIKVHGLPGPKKRELEETLRNFAMSLDDSRSPQQCLPADSMTLSNYGASSAPALEPHVTSSSHTSTKFADSAYASASGQHSITPSVKDRSHRKTPKPATTRDQDIQSYLHDIPSVLLPKQPVAMAEKAKRKLVVRKLEQIFAGKGAAIGGHQQPLQQQEVSQSAATADRLAVEASGRRAKAEGVREARIMSKGDPADTDVTVGCMEIAQDLPAITRPEERDTSGNVSPDQRPARPLDLDLHRAQVPKENINYIRHLGFSPADFDAAQDEGHGWIYLNVLTNMAQLHTLNVTTDFVIKSISDYSKKLHLSSDGRKVRWKGRHKVTRTSSDGSPGTQSPYHQSSSKKKPSLEQTSSIDSSGSPDKSRAGSSNMFNYTPLFFHKQESEGDGEISDELVTSLSSPQQEQVKGSSSGLTSRGMRTNSSKRKRGEDGPIIFYNKAKFCTDLSGDQSNLSNGTPSNLKYITMVSDPVGMDISQSLSSPDVDQRRKPLTTRASGNDMDLDSSNDEISESEDGGDFNFSPKSTSGSLQQSKPASIHFEVSGLGGVQPTDNFKIEVQSRRKSMARQKLPNASHFSRNKTYPNKIMEILRDSQTGTPLERRSALGSRAIEEEVVSTRQHDLPASELPPPASFFALDSPEYESDSDSTDSGDGSDVSSLANDDRPPPSTVPQMLQFSSNSSDEEDDDTSDSDGSVDLLANARQADPMAVYEQERQYDAHIADKLAEEIAAGSSAATAGGGSGFNSPASPELVGTDTRRRGSGGLVPSLKRARISDSSIPSVNKSAKME